MADITPIQGESFSDYWKRQYWVQAGTMKNGLASDDPNSFFSKVSNFFDGSVDSARDRYNQWYNEQSAAKKAQSDYEMSRVLRSTQYQDIVKDLRAAGINPYAVLANGGMSAGNLGYSSSEAPMKGQSKDSSKAKAIGAIAIIIGAILKAVL